MKRDRVRCENNNYFGMLRDAEVKLDSKASEEWEVPMWLVTVLFAIVLILLAEVIGDWNVRQG